MWPSPGPIGSAQLAEDKDMEQHSLADQLRLATARATASMRQAHQDLTSLIETAEAERSRLEEQMQAAAAAIQKHPDFDEDGLRAFFEKPYVVLPIPGTLDRFWIVVPRFLNMRAGWAVRRLNRFVSLKLPAIFSSSE